jgi:type IV secretion system protein VirD4
VPQDGATVIADDAPSQVSASIPTVDFGDAVVSVMTENMNKVMDKALAEQDQGVEKVVEGNALDSLDVGMHDDPDAAAESAALTQPDDDTQDYESDAISEERNMESAATHQMQEALAEAMAAADRMVGGDSMETLAISIP